MRREHDDESGDPRDDASGECHRRRGNAWRVVAIWLLMRECRGVDPVRPNYYLVENLAKRPVRMIVQDRPGSSLRVMEARVRPGGPLDGRRLRRNLDRAGPGNRRGGDHPRRPSILRSAARAEVVEEDSCRSPDCDNRADDDRSQAAVQPLASRIHCYLANPLRPMLLARW